MTLDDFQEFSALVIPFFFEVLMVSTIVYSYEAGVELEKGNALTKQERANLFESVFWRMTWLVGIADIVGSQM